MSFRYARDLDRSLYRILTIGRQTITDATYEWEGRTREGGGVIFQYTVAGEGKLRFGEEEVALKVGHAFLVEARSDYRYWFDPEAGACWEFLWIRITGPGAEEFVQNIHGMSGPVLVLQPEGKSVRLLYKLHENLIQERLADDKYIISMHVYEWMLELLRGAETGGEDGRSDVPPAFERAASYMNDHFNQPISLEQVAAYARLSKHHLSRLFPRYYGFSPIHYLRRKRVREALRLLRDTDLSATEIASSVGFDTLGYFGKVFREIVGMSPTDYRNQQSDLSADRIKLLD